MHPKVRMRKVMTGKFMMQCVIRGTGKEKRPAAAAAYDDVCFTKANKASADTLDRFNRW
jgi:hypothetical protein